jgi:hypothetical protein
MRIRLGNLRGLLGEASEQLELPFPPPELQAVAWQGHEINAQIKGERDREARNELYSQRSALVDQMRDYRMKLLEQMKMARQTDDAARVAEIEKLLEQVTYVASVDVMGYSGPTSEVFMTQRQVYGGNPKDRPWGLGS